MSILSSPVSARTFSTTAASSSVFSTRSPLYVLMELMFGAFVGMMRAQWEGRIELSDAVIAGAEQACWDAVAVHDLPPRA